MSTEVSRRIARRLGRSPETVRYTIRNFDKEHPDTAVFPEVTGPLDDSAKDDIYTVVCEGKSFRLQLLDERRALRPEEESSGSRKGDKEVRAVMPGKVVDVLVTVGDEVSKDQGVLIVEAMKMENEVRTSASGKVKEIRVSPGQAVESGELLVVLE